MQPRAQSDDLRLRPRAQLAGRLQISVQAIIGHDSTLPGDWTGFAFWGSGLGHREASWNRISVGNIVSCVGTFNRI